MPPISRFKQHGLQSKASTKKLKVGLSYPLKASSERSDMVPKMYQDLVEMAHEGITMVDPADNLTYVNKQFAKSLGYKVKDLVGRSIFSLVTRESASLIKRGTELRRKGHRSRYEITMIHRDGSKRIFRLSASPLYGPSREFRGSMGVYADVTEKKAMDVRLKRKVRQINTLYKVYHHARMAKSVKSIFDGVVQEIVQIMPYSEYIQSKLVYDDKVFTYPKKPESFIKKIETPIVIEGVHRGFLQVGYAKEMPKVPHDANLKEERELMAIVGGILSRHLLARNVLVRHKEIVNRSFTGIVIVSDDRIRFANARFCRIFKCREGVILGKKIQSFLPELDLKKSFSRKVKECHGRLMTGEKFDVAVILQKIEHLGKPAVLVRVSDISPLKQAQKRLSQFNQELKETVKEKTRHLEEANRRLQSLNLLKDEFITVTSHELRSPLTSIRGYLSFLVEDEAINQLSTPYREYLMRAYSTTDALNYLINNILDVSRLDMGRFQLQRIDTDIVELTRSILDSLSYQFNERKLTLEFDNKTGQEQFYLSIDSIRMFQVLRNILDNSIKFTKRGKKISVLIDVSGDYLRIKVADEGVGIPTTKLDVIFDKFMQVKNTHTKYKGGVGLGLFIAKRIVELHGGVIKAARNAKKGTTISVLLPIHVMS